ncbi:MAG TPA: flagellar basal body-associated FliL family protein [Alphaproteobacteria bacterium]
MADKDAAAAADDGAEEAPRKRRIAGKKIVLFGVLPALVLIGAGVGLLTSGLFGGGADEAGEAMPGDQGMAEARSPDQAVFYDLPPMLVNLNSGARQSSFLKIQVSLELGGPDAVPEVEAMLPRIVDNFQVYLRELRPDELSGTKGVARLKEELLVRVNRAVEPVTVYDILFKEILVQS